MQNQFWHLNNFNLYHILCPVKLKGHVKEHFHVFQKGDIIYSKGDLAQKIYLVGKGKVKIVSYSPEGNEMVKVFLKKGELFGEKAILGETQRCEFAIADARETWICPLSMQDMHKLMRKDKRFEVYIYKLIGFRIRKIERRLELLLFKDVKVRLIEFIKGLIQDENLEITHQIKTLEIEHIYTHDNIAHLIGCTRETVTKLLRQLQEKQCIEYHRNKIIVYQPYALLNLSSSRQKRQFFAQA